MSLGAGRVSVYISGILSVWLSPFWNTNEWYSLH